MTAAGSPRSGSEAKPWLAVTVHDRAASMLPGVVRNVRSLAQVFEGIAVSGTLPTDQRIFDGLGYRLDRIEADEIKAPGEVGRDLVWVFPP